MLAFITINFSQNFGAIFFDAKKNKKVKQEVKTSKPWLRNRHKKKYEEGRVFVKKTKKNVMDFYIKWWCIWSFGRKSPMRWGWSIFCGFNLANFFTLWFPIFCGLLHIPICSYEVFIFEETFLFFVFECCVTIESKVTFKELRNFTNRTKKLIIRLVSSFTTINTTFATNNTSTTAN